MNVWQTDGINTRVIGILTADKRVRVIEDKGAWTFVAYDGGCDRKSISGWVSKYLTTSSAATR